MSVPSTSLWHKHVVIPVRFLITGADEATLALLRQSMQSLSAMQGP